MSDVLFNNQGVPLLAYGKKSLTSTFGAPRMAAISKTQQEEKPAVSEQIQEVEDTTDIGTDPIVNWGENNDFPTTANDIIRKVGVLNTGLKFIRNFTLGQGIFPCRVTGYDDKGNEQLEIVDDEELIQFCQSRMVRRYLEKLLRDYLKFGIGNVELIPNEDGSELVGINTINSMYARYTVANQGVIEKVLISGKWPDNPSAGEYEVRDLLDEYDPVSDLKRRQIEGNIKDSFVFAVRDSWSNADYYSEPIWMSAYLAGWIDIAKVVPNFLKTAYQNQITWKWHVQIPYAFWDKKFPAEGYATVEARQSAIQEYLDSIEESLCSPENANKAIFTFFEINPQSGKHEEQWIIQPLDNKHKDTDKLFTSAAANSEILFSLMLNPNVLGAGMPGGTYAGNQGGSNIREAFLVNIANSWIDRQNILDPLEAYLEFNGVEGVQLRFRSTILTTLDEGAGTEKTLS
jgi:hypothetical protein